MKLFKLLSALSMFVGTLLFSSNATAQGVSYTPAFTGSGTVIGSLAQLRDNIYPAVGVNGFALNSVKVGTLQFTFSGDWNLSAFRIWNNMNGTFGGVTDFQLSFYDSSNNLLGTMTQTGVSRLAPPTTIPLSYVGVHRVQMTITNSDVEVEIREIQFEGTPTPEPPRISTCCPPSATYPVTTMFNSVQANIAGPYHLNFTMAPAFDAQMAAYVALLKTLDPSVTVMAVAVNAYNGGTGATAAISGGPLQTGVPYWIPPPGPTSGVLWPFFTATANLPANTWTVVEMTVWVGRERGPWVQLCEIRRFAFRPQVVGLRRSSATPFVDYTGPAPRTPAPPPPAIPQRR